MSTGAEHQEHDQAGRHRLSGGGEAWTPPVPPHTPRPAASNAHRHRLTGQPMDPPSTGSLPLAPPRPVTPRQQQPLPPLPQPRSANRLPQQASGPEPVSGFQPTRGSLSVPQYLP
ncbi:hypothetical protein QMK34_46095, partial [Amycolatopsis sp. H20-H5]|nr:hypothetical protein [Amycolatopsis sp. H20-H5]